MTILDYDRHPMLGYRCMGKVDEETTSASMDVVDSCLREAQEESHKMNDLFGIKVSLSPLAVDTDGSPSNFQLYFPSIRSKEGEPDDLGTIDLPNNSLIHKRVMDLLPTLAKTANGDARKLRRLIAAQIELMKSEEN